MVAAFVSGFGFARYRYDVAFNQRIHALMFGAFHQWAERKLILVGDSRVTALSCPSAFARWKVINLGVSGSTAGQTLGLLKLNLQYYGQFEAGIIWSGINDVRFGRDVESAIDDMVAVLDLLATWAKQVLMLGQFPIRGDDPSAGRVNSALQAMNLEAAARTSARGQRFMVPQVTDRQPELYADAIHLSDRGNQVVCAKIGEWLDNRIEK